MKYLKYKRYLESYACPDLKGGRRIKLKNIFDREKTNSKLEQFYWKQHNSIEGRALKRREKPDIAPISNAN